MSAKFAIGIDLGTTNSVLAYAPLGQENPQVSLLSIPQLATPNSVENRQMLPSFLYLGTEAEAAALKEY
jgi:molecular chaperone DnaK (HSP70)